MASLPESLSQPTVLASSVAQEAQGGETCGYAFLPFLGRSVQVYQRTDRRRLGHGELDAWDRANPDGILFNTRKTIPYLEQVGLSDSSIDAITVENLRPFFGARHT